MSANSTPKSKRIWAIVLWVVLAIVGGIWFYSLGIPPKELPGVIRDIVAEHRVAGIGLIVGIWALRTFILVPPTVLVLASGLIFGPWFGIVANLLGEAFAATVTFYLARFGARGYVQENLPESWRKYERRLCEDGLFMVFFFRISFLPFDLGSIAAGVSRIRYVPYMVGTMLGAAPATIALTILGDAITTQRGMLLFLPLAGFCVLAAVLAHRSKRMNESCDVVVK